LRRFQFLRMERCEAIETLTKADKKLCQLQSRDARRDL
jgi:hypothetical protein